MAQPAGVVRQGPMRQLDSAPEREIRQEPWSWQPRRSATYSPSLSQCFSTEYGARRHTPIAVTLRHCWSTELKVRTMDFKGSSHVSLRRGPIARLGVVRTSIIGLAALPALLTVVSGTAVATGVTSPVITATQASFTIPQGAQTPAIGTTWLLKLQDLTTKKVIGSQQFATTAEQPSATLEIPVPTVDGCHFQVDVRTTPPGQPVSPTSGTFYSDLIAVVPGCGTTAPTTTTTTTTLPTVSATSTIPTTTTIPPVVSAGTVDGSTAQLPFTAASTSTTASTQSELPFTGLNTQLLAGLGLLLVGVGYLLMRRRPARKHASR
jgi:hypothetical protein